MRRHPGVGGDPTARRPAAPGVLSGARGPRGWAASRAPGTPCWSEKREETGPSPGLTKDRNPRGHANPPASPAPAKSVRIRASYPPLPPPRTRSAPPVCTSSARRTDVKPLVPGCGEFTARERQTFAWKTAHNPSGGALPLGDEAGGRASPRGTQLQGWESGKRQAPRHALLLQAQRGSESPTWPWVTVSLQPFRSHGSPCHRPHALVRRASGQGPPRESSLGAGVPAPLPALIRTRMAPSAGSSAQGHRPLASDRNKWSALLGKGNHDFLRGQPRNPRFPRGAFRARHGT